MEFPVQLTGGNLSSLLSDCMSASSPLKRTVVLLLSLGVLIQAAWGPAGPVVFI